MHIKQVIVEGFKTYREQTAADFEPHLNCIVRCHAQILPVGTPFPDNRPALKTPPPALLSRPDAPPRVPALRPEQSARMVRVSPTCSTPSDSSSPTFGSTRARSAGWGSCTRAPGTAGCPRTPRSSSTTPTTASLVDREEPRLRRTIGPGEGRVLLTASTSPRRRSSTCWSPCGSAGPTRTTASSRARWAKRRPPCTTRSGSRY